MLPPCLLEGGQAGALMRRIDWGATSLGSPKGWPASLKTTVAILLRSRQPMFLWWGPELVQFYNDAYTPSFGVGKHPTAMGQRGADCWQEIWPLIWPQIEDVMLHGKASWNEDQFVPIFRNDRLEEVYWTYGYSPVLTESGAIGGTLVVCTETTARILGARRQRTQRALVEATAGVSAPDALFTTAATTLAGATKDIPFALFYARSAGELILGASCGLAASTTATLDPGLRAQLLGERPAAGRVALDGRLGPLACAPWPEQPSDVFVADIAPDGRVAGRVVFGLGPRLPFDDRYREHLQQLADQLGSALAGIEGATIRLAAAAERRHLLLEAPVATALMLGPRHRFELANDLYRQMVGREVVGKDYLEAFPELAGSPLPGILAHVYRTGEPFVTSELLVPLDRNGDGVVEDSYFKFNLVALHDAGGAIYGMMAVSVDITELVQARLKLEKTSVEREQLLAELETASRAKDEFLAMLGHELRNPLSPIVTALQLMRVRNPGELGREEQIIHRHVAHLVRLVDDLLDVSKITRGKVELKKEVVELAEVLARAVELASDLFEQRGHQLTVVVPRTGLRWFGDPVRLAQVVANLLTNAARYTGPGGQVRLEAFADGLAIVIGVKDSGIGISAEMLPRIFDLFVQSKRSSDRSEGGLGLGLSLVKTLVTMHGGTVVATSGGAGRGSEFVIRLPGATMRAVDPGRGSAPVGIESAASGRRVLLVDDNVDSVDLLGETLSFAGHTVAVAYDPLTALQQLHEVVPEVAVLDIGLPVMDGYELAAQVRKALPSCRLVALTGYGQEHDAARSLQAGFAVHLVKPVEIARLLRIISG